MFPGRHASLHLTRRGFDHALRNAVEELGLQGTSTQSFRSSFLTSCNQNGVPRRNIQSISEHSNLQVLANYIEVSDSDKSACVLADAWITSMNGHIDHTICGLLWLWSPQQTPFQCQKHPRKTKSQKPKLSLSAWWKTESRSLESFHPLHLNGVEAGHSATNHGARSWLATAKALDLVVRHPRAKHQCWWMVLRLAASTLEREPWGGLVHVSRASGFFPGELRPTANPPLVHADVRLGMPVTAMGLDNAGGQSWCVNTFASLGARSTCLHAPSNPRSSALPNHQPLQQKPALSPFYL